MHILLWNLNPLQDPEMGYKITTNYQYYAMYYTVIFNLFMTISIVIISLCNILYMLVYTLLW